MRPVHTLPQVIALVVLCGAGLALQFALLPAFAPRVLQPDLFVLMGLSALAFGSKEFGITALFIFGLAGELAGNGRVGLLPLCYLLSAAIILKLSQRELTRGDLLAAWVAGLGATLLAHVLYAPLAGLFGNKFEFGASAARLASLAVAACFWGLPVAYLTGSLMYKFQIMSPQVRARWSNNERTHEARKRQAG